MSLANTEIVPILNPWGVGVVRQMTAVASTPPPLRLFKFIQLSIYFFCFFVLHQHFYTTKFKTKLFVLKKHLASKPGEISASLLMTRLQSPKYRKQDSYQTPSTSFL